MAATLGRLDEALRLDRRAIEVDPLSVQAHFYLGLHASYAGHLDEAEGAFRRALELDPGHPVAHLMLGRLHIARSNPQAALEEMERETEPSFRRFGLALAYHALGRSNEADAALRELIEKDKWSYQIAQVYAFRGEVDASFEWLGRAFAERDGGLTEITADPLLRNLEGDPRYSAFLTKLGLSR
jgi:serine/threonine-protein kinase